MIETTARLTLPLLMPGQAQKEMTHNEALALLDLAAFPVAEAVGVDTPPADPAIGACWIVGTTPTGVWSDHAQALAGWTAGGWRFVRARAGMAVAVPIAGAIARFDGANWIVRAPEPFIAPPSGGDVVDLQARSAIVAVLDALRAHGLVVVEPA